MRSPLALIALIALCVSVGARADTDEPFNGAVHSDPGVDTAVDDGMTLDEIRNCYFVLWFTTDSFPSDLVNFRTPGSLLSGC